MSRVDPTAQQFVLTDGTVVRVTGATNLHRNEHGLTLAQVAPGTEVVVRFAAAPAAGGSALPRRTPPPPPAAEVVVIAQPSAPPR